MHNRSILLFFSILTCGFSMAQSLSTSPYSRHGIGEEGGYADSQFGAYGNAQTSVIDSATINSYNPASYSFLSKGQTLFGLGVSSRFSTYKYNGTSYNAKVIGLNNLNFAFPVNARLGFGAGLKPFARRGYNIQTKEAVGSGDSATYTYLGSGSLQQIFIGGAYKIVNTNSAALSIGVNGGILFGTTTNERRAVFNDEVKGGIGLENYRVKSFYYSAGLNYMQRLDSTGRKFLNVSAVFTPEQKINGYKDSYLYYASNVNYQYNLSTIDSVTNDKGYVMYPQKMSFGLAYSFKPDGEKRGGKRIYQLNAFGDLTLTTWSKYSEHFQTTNTITDFKNGMQVAAGLQFIPLADQSIKLAKLDFLSHLKYRIGGSYSALPYSINNKQVTQKLVSAGVGIPLAGAKSNSFLNLGVQYGTQGTAEASALREQFFSFSVGVIIAPQPYDRWFRKYKLD